MKYYVNKGTCFGVTFDAKNHDYAVAYAEGFAYGKEWEKVNLYCKDTNEQIAKDLPAVCPWEV